MNILIDIGHPAHVHYYRNLAMELAARGHRIHWTVKDIPVARRLLDAYRFQYTVLPKKPDALIGKILKQALYDSILVPFCLKHRIDIAIGTSVTVVHVSGITKVRSIVFDDDDDEVQPMITRYVHPYADALLSPNALFGKRRKKDTIYYPGYHELAYLHPNRFTPDPRVLKEVGLGGDERFFIVRFNSFRAHHDVGAKGLSFAQKRKLIELLEPMGRVLITAEREVEPELRRFQVNVRPEAMHSLMSYATLLVGDSQTMSSEAAVLGVPSLRCNTFAGRLSYLEEEEQQFGLTFGYTPDQFDALLDRAKKLINQPELKQEWNNRRQRMLEEKIDVTAFWVWFVENFPASGEIMRRDPEYAKQFR